MHRTPWNHYAAIALTAVAIGGATYSVSSALAASSRAALETRIKDLEAQLEIYQPPSKAGMPPESHKATGTAFKLPELGIQLTLPASLSDLSYTTMSGKLQSGQAYTVAYVSTTSLVAMDKACDSALGALSKVSGRYPATGATPENSIRSIVEQFPNFYISYQHPQSLCSDDNSVEARAYILRTTFRDSFRTITEIK